MPWRTLHSALPRTDTLVLISNGRMITIARWRPPSHGKDAGWWDEDELYLGIGAEWWQPLPLLPVGEPPLDRQVREASER
jgi:hypothetical protein